MKQDWFVAPSDKMGRRAITLSLAQRLTLLIFAHLVYLSFNSLNSQKELFFAVIFDVKETLAYR